ncbi:hypothetical protein K438DRAFT_2026709 [Mycena galopus ATCC 62051]|nr:hypothetical protein K438DRAFT_2026709 [Mycena galopus ATCC 62051]
MAPRHASLLIYVCEYDSWRRARPTEDRPNAPLLKLLRANHNSKKDDDDEETDTKLFFPASWIPAEDSDHDVQRNDSASEQATETDKAQRNDLIGLVKQTSGFSVDTSRLQFESVKDVHPFRDPLKTVCPFVSTLLIFCFLP